MAAAFALATSVHGAVEPQREGGETPLPAAPSGFPSRALVLMAPANPGGGWDQTARLMQHVLTTRRIVPVPVEVLNRGGAGGTIGLAELVSRHRRDPHMVMIGGAVMLGAVVMHASPFTLDDTVPLARLTSEYEVVAVPPDSPYRSLPELLDAFRRAPESVAWGGGSAGGLDHMLVGLIAQKIGVPADRVRYVAFTGGGEAAAAVMGGQVTAAVSGYGEWKAHERSGRMRMLGISSPQRPSLDMPPTFRDAGLDVAVSNWRCIVAPPGISADARAWLVEALRRMRATPEWQEWLRRNDWEDSFLEGDAFERFLHDEMRATAATLAALRLGSEGRGYAVVGPWAVPAAIGLGLALSLGWLAVEARWRPRRPSPTARHVLAWPSLAGTLILLGAYALSFEVVGFPLATGAYLLLQARLLGRRAWLRDAIASAALVAVTYLVFSRLLNVSLPLGLLAAERWR